MLVPLRDEFASAIRSRKRKHDGGMAHREPDIEHNTVIRLLSHRPAVLSEPELLPEWPSRKKIHPTEDNKEEEIERRRRANFAAIDVKTIIVQSKVVYPAYKRDNVIENRTVESDSIRPILVLESERPNTSLEPIGWPQSSKVVPRDTKPKPDLLVRARSTQRTVRKLHAIPRAPSFYSSTNTVGGKSPGYGWGYAGSFPRSEGSCGYIRDKMRKGMSIAGSLKEGEAPKCNSRKSNRAGNER
ncbi:hypothetical protein FRC09_007497 [Ceratobasidium sp. 395]|nr:hypothetical protein FRC09_007497 [Ceratobasidium sp. 395]